MKSRIALGMEYDGSRFCGWQSQARGCGVQNALEKALSEIAGGPVTTVSAGRTDAGVHALTQVVHFDVAAERPMSAWVRGGNALLPQTAAVQWAVPIGADFHARFSARSRGYHYVLLNHAVRPARLAGKIGWFHVPLDLGAMREAAQPLIGRQDFSAFRAAECQAASPVKNMVTVQIERYGDYIVFEFRADAFLHHMVRNLVGSLVYVGAGKRPAGWMRELLESRDRSRCAPTFAPDGLYLTSIRYDATWGLPEFRDRDFPQSLVV